MAGLMGTAVLVLLASCAAPSNPVPYAATYPELPRDRTLDIQVFRSSKRLELTNTTATAFGPSTIWLNKWYSYPIDGLAVGQSLDIPLTSFRDENSEAFRGGGFFATERPEDLVLAELETAKGGERVLYRLIVIDGRGEP